MPDLSQSIVNRIDKLEKTIAQLKNRDRAPDTLILRDGVTAPSAVTALALIYVDTADGDLKIRFSDGTIKTIVVDT